MGFLSKLFGGPQTPQPQTPITQPLEYLVGGVPVARVEQLPSNTISSQVFLTPQEEQAQQIALDSLVREIQALYVTPEAERLDREDRVRKFFGDMAGFLEEPFRKQVAQAESVLTRAGTLGSTIGTGALQGLQETQQQTLGNLATQAAFLWPQQLEEQDFMNRLRRIAVAQGFSPTLQGSLAGDIFSRGTSATQYYTPQKPNIIGGIAGLATGLGTLGQGAAGLKTIFG